MPPPPPRPTAFSDAAPPTAAVRRETFDAGSALDGAGASDFWKQAPLSGVSISQLLVDEDGEQLGRGLWEGTFGDATVAVKVLPQPKSNPRRPELHARAVHRALSAEVKPAPP
eukprot:1005785-Prymnesium_polylepis.1